MGGSGRGLGLGFACPTTPRFVLVLRGIVEVGLVRLRTPVRVSVLGRLANEGLPCVTATYLKAGSCGKLRGVSGDPGAGVLGAGDGCDEAFGQQVWPGKCSSLVSLGGA